MFSSSFIHFIQNKMKHSYKKQRDLSKSDKSLHTLHTVIFKRFYLCLLLNSNNHTLSLKHSHTVQSVLRNTLPYQYLDMSKSLQCESRNIFQKHFKHIFSILPDNFTMGVHFISSCSTCPIVIHTNVIYFLWTY